MVTTSDAPASPQPKGVDPVALSMRLLTAAAIATTLAAAIYLLMIRTTLGQRVDNAALIGSLEQDPTSRLRDVFFLERISAGSFAVVLIAIVVAGLLRHRRVLGVAAALAALVSVVGTDLLKDDVLTRPFLVTTCDVFRSGNTFPSGHTATAISCAFALVILAPPAVRGLVAILVGAYSWSVAADVETAGWHRPSDAIAASLLCFAVICVVAAALLRTRRVGTGTRYSHPPALAVLGLVWIVSTSIAAINAARVLRALARTPGSTTLTPALLNQSYQFSVNLTVAVVVTLLIALLLLLGRADLDEPKLHP
jgi:membrane-associated phospholipid phosphatase